MQGLVKVNKSYTRKKFIYFLIFCLYQKQDAVDTSIQLQATKMDLTDGLRCEHHANVLFLLVDCQTCNFSAQQTPLLHHG